MVVARTRGRSEAGPAAGQAPNAAKAGGECWVVEGTGAGAFLGLWALMAAGVAQPNLGPPAGCNLALVRVLWRPCVSGRSLSSLGLSVPVFKWAWERSP